MPHSAKGPSQRMLRVGEQVRHALSETLQRGEILDPLIEQTVVSVSEVRMSPDLKIATVFVSPLGAADDDAVLQALAQTGLTALADRPVHTLSGGQRQRAWLAFALAQNAPVMLLDEPTTYLDIAHQLEVLDLCRRLNRQQGKTLVMVLHDLNQAARYADHIIALRDGKVEACGPPVDVLTPQRVQRLFGIRCVVMADPVSGTPLVVPIASAAGD